MVEYKEQQLDLVFHALANATRRHLILHIMKGQSNVLKLAKPFDMSLNAVSKHLKVLEEADLVTRSKKGREYYFKVNPEALARAHALITQLKEFWDMRLDALD